MFVKSSFEIPFAMDDVTPPLRRSPTRWLHPLLLESRAQGRLLRAEIGADVSPQFGRVRLDMDDVAVFGDTTTLPFHARVQDGEAWAAFDWIMSASWLGERRTQLSLQGRYPQPSWMSHRHQTLLHRTVECQTRLLLVTVAAELSERAHTASS